MDSIVHNSAKERKKVVYSYCVDAYTLHHGVPLLLVQYNLIGYYSTGFIFSSGLWILDLVKSGGVRRKCPAENIRVLEKADRLSWKRDR